MSERLPVLLLGAGVAGPALAISLHQQGYKVILFEKYDGPAQGGASLHLAPNGFRVLDKLGIKQPIFDRNIASPVEVLSYRTNTGPLVVTDILTKVHEQFGYPFAGVKRSLFLQYLIECVQARGIEVRFGYSVETIEQEDKSVTAIFQNGQKVKGAFAVGCDGLHSRTRIALFGDEVAEYTGLTQTCGLTLIPRRIRHLQNIYADKAHMISYSVGVKVFEDPNSGTHGDTTLISWAITCQEEESRESWKSEANDNLQQSLLKVMDCDWVDGISVNTVIKGAPEYIKFGLYDRKALSTWHRGRVVLIGDAAHPTGPHLGQGANQTLEDVSCLTSLLKEHVPPSAFANDQSPATETLKAAFDALDKLRISHTAALVQSARETGRLRVLPEGSADAEERNRATKEDWSLPEEQILKRYEKLLGPRK